MTRQDLSSDTTTLVADGAEMVVERTFAAPRELVWAVMTSPEHIPHWWGPHGTTTTVVEMDVRPGGSWKWANGQAVFTGEYLEVVPPERFVRTSRPDMGPDDDGGPGAVETITLEEVDGATRVRHHARFPSEEVLDFALSQGMTKGVLEEYDRIADLLPELA